MEHNKLSGKDLDQLKAKGISMDVLKEQLMQFEEGFPAADLAACATPGHGIEVLSAAQLKELRTAYQTYRKTKEARILKFVPASGAATRMFKDLYASYNKLKEAASGASSTAQVSAEPLDKPTQYFFDHLAQYPFYAELKATLKSKTGLDLDQAAAEKNYLPILETLLENGMGYGKLPKALLLFHTYADGPVTAMAEHFAEGAQYAAGGGQCRLHFTISAEHKDLFLKQVADIKPKYEKQYGLSYQVDYSVQKPSTDTVAVTLDNEIYRDEQQRMVFRPGGHGALIENLNDLSADVIFIKNIDNISIGTKREETIVYKEALAGLLIERREKAFEILRTLSAAIEADNKAKSGKNAQAGANAELAGLPWQEWFDFAHKELQIKLNDECLSWPTDVLAHYFFAVLNRPMRVCGMVKNEGEPGGGPFWVSRVNTFHDPFVEEDMDEEVDNIPLRLWPIESLQIVESSQIDHESPDQEDIFRASTHFNPVDLVCSVCDFNGKKFDLKKFIDPMTAFISQKSVKGTDIKAMELPGLWNGAMADWITLFVEEPIEVFTPVKTVNDLLRDGHKL